jgi:hypothetical protein
MVTEPLLSLVGRLAADERGLCLLLDPEAFALDPRLGGVVEQAVEDRRGQYVVVEDLAPVREAPVRGDDQGRPLVSAPDGSGGVRPCNLQGGGRF